jgi:hypothetical protein
MYLIVECITTVTVHNNSEKRGNQFRNQYRMCPPPAATHARHLLGIERIKRWIRTCGMFLHSAYNAVSSCQCVCGYRWPCLTALPNCPHLCSIELRSCENTGHGSVLMPCWRKNAVRRAEWRRALSRVSTAQLLSTSVLALKYEHELNCQKKSKFYKFILKRRIISLRHSFILRRIWLNFMALCLISDGSFSFHIYFSDFQLFRPEHHWRDLSSRMRIWCIKIGSILVLHYPVETEWHYDGLQITGQLLAVEPHQCNSVQWECHQWYKRCAMTNRNVTPYH